MLDNECKRMEAGWLLEDGKLAKSDATSTNESDPTMSTFRSTAGNSIWDYIDQHNKKSPVFYNFLFCPHDHETVTIAFVLATGTLTYKL